MIAGFQTTIDTFFRDNVLPEIPGFKVFYDNQKANVDGSEGDGWCRHQVSEVDSSYASLGRRHKRSSGFVTLQHFIPSGAGTTLIREFEAIVEQKYSGVCVSGVRFEPPTRDFSGTVGDWYQNNIIIPFILEN